MRRRATTLEERDLKRMSLRVPIEIHEGLMTLGRAYGRSLNRLAVEALHEYLMRHGTWEPVESWLLRTGQRYRAAVSHILPEAEGAEDAKRRAHRSLVPE